MAFDPATFYTVAHWLSRSAASEAHLRSCISRAYYGAFVVARDSAHISTLGPDGHKRVIKHYAEGDSIDQLIADSLKSLKVMRERADYESGVTCPSSEGTKAMTLSAKVLKIFDKLPSVQTPEAESESASGGSDAGRSAG